MARMDWRRAALYGRRTLDHRFENEMPDAAERWLRRAERRLQQQRITVIASSSVISPSNPGGIRAHRTGKSAHTGGRLGRASLVFLHRREATWEKKPYLTVDNQMTRNPNLALNAEIESMAERLTQTARDPK